MARKDSQSAVHARGFSDIIGITLMALALLLLVAQLTFHPHDVSANRVPPNETIRTLDVPSSNAALTETLPLGSVRYGVDWLWFSETPTVVSVRMPKPK